MTLKKDILKLSQSISKMTAVVEKMVTIINAMEITETKPVKSKPAPKKKAKKSLPKKAATKKEIKEKPVAKKTPVKKETKEKADGVTAMDTVLAIIKESKNGINTTDLMAKTGFNAKKVQNNVAKLKKKGQIKTVSRGVFGVA